MKNKVLILAISVLPFLYSCGDDTTEDPTPVAQTKTKTELICASPWKATAITIDPAIDVGGTQITDWFSQFENCTKDDLYKFESNKTALGDEGPTKCDPSDPQSWPSTWTFDLTETKLTWDGDSYDIVELTATSMVLKMTIDGEDIGGQTGVKYTMTSKFAH